MRCPRPSPARDAGGSTSERGLTLVETTVATMLLSLVLAVVVPFVTDSATVLTRQQSRADTNDDLHLSMAQIERDVRSGNIIDAPTAVAGVAGMDLVVYTQTSGAPFTCVQYRVEDGELRRRTREPGPGVEWPLVWRSVASGVVNASESPAVPAFSRSADKQTLHASLVIRHGSGEAAAARVDTSVTGRNTRFYDTAHTENPCD